MSRYAETSIVYKLPRNFRLGALYLHKLKQEKAGALEKANKQIKNIALLLRDLKALPSPMKVLDKDKLQDMKLVRIARNQFHSLFKKKQQCGN